MKSHLTRDELILAVEMKFNVIKILLGLDELVI